MMLRYRLDDLGWFHFEKLVQSLLKADLGLAVQSWGGHSDLGRDAYADTPLRFPDRSVLADGPFVFQAKFVQAANATGADWRASLLRAVSSERASIKVRRGTRRWRDAAHYILLTNCPLTAGARESVRAELVADLPTSEITTLGGSDICDLLDQHPELRRAFPEILSLRDLDTLLAEVVNRTLLERSRAAVDEARDLVPVFVPTKAYHRALRSLGKHSFVVLDGPPEMGKTAIARTIALTHLLTNCQVVDCRDPDDFFSVFTPQRRQLFVADDAFGRTEYDPVLGRMWERDLPRVFQFLDSRHKLIWTTRKHILMRARREMDLTGKSSRFPAPGEVIVTADDLSTEEKARILYRHSRAARLSEKQRQAVRDHATAIVKNEHFTPERIRRLVRELLPEVAGKRVEESVTPEDLPSEISAALRDPTDRMRKSFRKLPLSHMWILIAFLECDGPVQSDALRSRFALFLPESSERAFAESLDDLLGTFLKLGSGAYPWEGKRINWVHPSYRDLVIDELSANTEHQLSFLRRTSTGGVKLALSLAGGSHGERQLPLMATSESWTILSRRCREIASSEDTSTVVGLLDVLASALTAEGSPDSARLAIESILKSVCNTTANRWNEHGEPLPITALVTFHRARQAVPTPVIIPSIEATWEARKEEVRQEIGKEHLLEPYLIDEWFDFGDLIAEHYPLFAETAEFRAGRTQIEGELFEVASQIIRRGTALADPDFNESQGSRMERLADLLVRIDPLGERELVTSRLYGLAGEYEEDGSRDEPPYDDPGEWQPSRKEFDVEALFDDL